MIIKTVAGNFNKKMNINIEDKSIELFFNVVGECEIKDDKLANKLLDKYKGLLWPKDVEIEKPKTTEEKITEKAYEELLSEKNKLEKVLKEKKEEIEIINQDLEAWKSKYNESAKGVESLVKKHEEELKSSDIKLKRAELEIGLWKTGAKDLKRLCAESGYDKNDYEKLTAKEDLIDFILNKG